MEVDIAFNIIQPGAQGNRKRKLAATHKVDTSAWQRIYVAVICHCLKGRHEVETVEFNKILKTSKTFNEPQATLRRRFENVPVNLSSFNFFRKRHRTAVGGAYTSF